MSDEKFLSRWSRRKQQARRREPDREPATSASPQPDSDNPAVAEPDITAEEMMKLVEGKLRSMHFPGFLARRFAKEVPTLRRWRGKGATQPARPAASQLQPRA